MSGPTCPACAGSGCHDLGGRCPACLGAGELPAGQLAIDAEPAQLGLFGADDYMAPSPWRDAE